MTIKVGDRLPEAKFMTMGPDGPKALTTADVFAGKTVALFAVPGAYTPTCHKQHMPGFVERADEIKAKAQILADFPQAALRLPAVRNIARSCCRCSTRGCL